MEYVDSGELLEYLYKKKKLDENESRHFFKQLVSAIKYCHQLGIIHRDLKLENVLIDKLGNIKVIDFGLGDFSEVGKKETLLCGTQDYMPPEILQNIEYDGFLVDVWCLGIILFALNCGSLPFACEADAIKGSFEMNSSWSKELQDLLKKMLEPNPKNRFTMDDVLNHTWTTKHFKEYIDTHLNYVIDIDKQVIQKMRDDYGFLEQDIISSIENKEYNQLTETYFLLIDKKNQISKIK